MKFVGFPKKCDNISELAIAKLKEFLECGEKQVPEISKDKNNEYYFYFPEVIEILESN